jgi:hypothetical protein
VFLDQILYLVRLLRLVAVVAVQIPTRLERTVVLVAVVVAAVRQMAAVQETPQHNLHLRVITEAPAQAEVIAVAGAVVALLR